MAFILQQLQIIVRIFKIKDGKMKATVIISVDSNKTNFDNFTFFLSQYKCINDYEIIIVNDCADFLFDNTLFTWLMKTLKM